MKYDTNKIANIPIRDVAERLGLKLKKRGKDYITNCLWHDDKHPSMVVGGKINTCHCFRCEKSWNVINLVEKANNMDFKEACEWLENQGFNVSSQRSKFQVSSSKIKRLEALQARKGASLQKSPLGEGAVYFNKDYLDNKMNMDNSFARCLVEVFGEEAAMRVINQYRLGSYEMKYGYPAVMFPSIDFNGNILDIKIQSYDCNPQSPGFFHSDKEACFWLKSVLRSPALDTNIFTTEYGEAGFLPKGRTGGGSSCLFGEHLLSGSPPFHSSNEVRPSPFFCPTSEASKLERGERGGGPSVILVESPKNACVGAAKYPEYLWLATGNKGMLKREVLEVLQGRNVIVFPDNDAYDEWNAKLQQMQDITLFSCQHVPEGCGEKGDIADWILGAPQSPPWRGNV